MPANHIITIAEDSQGDIMISTRSIGICPHRQVEVFETRVFRKSNKDPYGGGWYPIGAEPQQFLDWEYSGKIHLNWVKGLGEECKIVVEF